MSKQRKKSNSKSSRKKKKKTYYTIDKIRKDKRKQDDSQDNRKKTFFDTVFMIGIGFLIMFYATYLVIPFSKYSVTIVGLVLIGYGSYKSLLISLGKNYNLKGKLEYSRSGVIFDISKLVLVGFIIIYCIYRIISIYVVK